MFWIFLIIITAVRLYFLVRKFNQKVYVNDENLQRSFAYPPFTEIADDNIWQTRARKYNPEVTQKRRNQVTAQYNEMITKGLFVTGYEADAASLKARLQGYDKNPAKHFSAAGVWLLLILSSLTTWAQSAADAYKQAEKMYGNKEYAKAAIQYKQVSDLDSSYKKASVLYKTALCYQKLKDCNTAKVYFVKSLQASPENGGASSISKFSEKIRECQLSVSELTLSNSLITNEEPPVIASANAGDSEQAKQFFKAADNEYDNKKYQTAIEKYNQALAADSSYKRAGVLYKIALSYQKLKNCDEAKNYFAQAYRANPENGGASSLSKFKEKAQKCGWSEGESSTANAEEYAPEADQKAAKGMGWFVSLLLAFPFGFLFAWIIYYFYKKKKSKEKQDLLRQELTTWVYDDNFWAIQESKYSPRKVQLARELFVENHQRAISTEDTAAITQLHFNFSQFKENPELFFANELNTSGLIRLQNTFSGAFYCFFTGEVIPEGRSFVLEIRHQNGASRKVWALGKIINKVQMGGKVKVRVHQVSGQWVHWSKDETWHNALATEAENAALQARWNGQQMEMDVFELYEIFTEKLTNYMAPHPDAIVQAVLQFRDDSASPTGYQGRNISPDSGGSRVDDLLTGVLIGRMLDNDHDHHRHDHHRDNS